MTEKAVVRTLRAITLSSVLLFCGSLPHAQSAEPKPAAGEVSQPFTLTIQGERLSLTAKKAPIKAVLDELGRQLHVEVIVKSPQDEKITTEFRGLTLDQALQGLSQRYATTKNKHGKIVQVVVIPKAQGSTAAKSDSAAQAKPEIPEPRTTSEPFKFEFDPSAYGTKQ